MDKFVTNDGNDCVFTVTRGVQTGARYLIPDGARLSIGNRIEHNIVLHDASGEDWSALIENQEGGLWLTTLSGDLQTDNRVLTHQQKLLVESDTEFSSGVTGFRFNVDVNRPTHPDAKEAVPTPAETVINQISEKWGVGKYAIKKTLFALSVCCIAIGTLSAIYVVTGSVIMVNATPQHDGFVFEDNMNVANYADIQYERRTDGQSYKVSGIVNTREQRNQILSMAREADTNVDLDLQVNDELIEAVQDVFRVYGFNVRVEVLGKGHVNVFSASNDLSRLSQVEQTVKTDIPAITKLVLTNTPPGLINEPSQPTKNDPDKRVTLIAAGNNAYIMTHDQSRYFVGGMLPSGHVVKSIRDGKVIVSKNGKTETLQY